MRCGTSRSAVACAALFLFACATTGAHAKPVAGSSAGSGELSDSAITHAVDNELAFDRAVPAEQIGVSTSDGIVSLTGTVDNLLAKDQALRLAETVRGVRSVINRIEVRPNTQISDRSLAHDVQDALFYDRATDSYEIAVTAKGGKVTLTGDVQSYAEKMLAGRVAKSVNGVRAVDNQLLIKVQANRPPQEIRAEVEKRLRWDALVDQGLIDVDVADGGKVSLSGTVGSAAEKTRATFDAWVAGVSEVSSDALEVESWARDKFRKTSTQPASDREIETAIDDALRLDPRVSSFDVTPTASAGVVVLRGEVDNIQARNAAAQVARATTGVVRVRNRIAIAPIRTSDLRIESRVISAIARNPYLDTYDIHVDSMGGTVFLSGSVDSYFEKLEADRVASSAAGIARVRNDLQVVQGGHPLVYDPHVTEVYPYAYEWYDYQPSRTYTNDTAIRDEIKTELWWSPYVDEDQVNVTVSDGIAKLQGTVDSYAERAAAVENAYEGGAVWVDNDLRVRR